VDRRCAAHLACFGFVPRFLTGIDLLGGLRSETLIVGLFHVSLLHNVVHLLLGGGALISAGSQRTCRVFLAAAGIAMVTVVVFGQIGGPRLVPDLVPVGAADTWLHTVLAVAMLAGAVLPTGRPRKPLDNL